MCYEYGMFKYYELLKEEHILEIPETLKIKRGVSEEALLFRLLLGTIHIQHKPTEKVIHQKNNYAKLGISKNSRISYESLYNSIVPIREFKDEFDRYITNNRRNLELYRNILVEFTNFFYQKNRKAHIAGFVHLYRCIEFISYPFPLIYVSKTRTYKHSYKQLQDFFSGSKGELSFFRTFIESFIDESILNLRVDFIFSISDEEMINNFNNIIKNIYDQAGINNREKDLTDTGGIISIPYRHYFDFVVTMRNRFFHMLNGGQNNISNINFDADTFFETINECTANWIAYVYAEMVRYGMESV